MPAFLA